VVNIGHTIADKYLNLWRRVPGSYPLRQDSYTCLPTMALGTKDDCLG